MKRRLTLNLGARYAHASGSSRSSAARRPRLRSRLVYPAKCWDRINFRTWNSIVPRLHAAYDITGNGRPSSRAVTGRFAHNWHSDELQMANENVHLVSRFLWHDLNGNKLFDPGEINFDLAGSGLRVDEPLHRRRGRPCGRRVEPGDQGADEQRVLDVARAAGDGVVRRAGDRHLFAAAGLPRSEQPAACTAPTASRSRVPIRGLTAS